MIGSDMGQELRNCEMEIRGAIRKSKLDPKTFKDDVEKSLDFPGQFFSNHLEKIRLLIDRGNYNRAVKELEKVRFKLL